jgi:hypothetical protein
MGNQSRCREGGASDSVRAYVEQMRRNIALAGVQSAFRRGD